jgi:hypothetical protein
MALEFPNNSRSYDSTRRAVRFWGYDGVFEIAFFIESGVLSSIAPGMRKTDAEILKCFDANWLKIIQAAGRTYFRRKNGDYSVGVADF